MAFSNMTSVTVRLKFDNREETIIRNDMSTFHASIDNGGRGAFFNTLIRNYYEEADASIALRIDKLVKNLKNIVWEYDPNADDNAVIKEYADFLDQKEKELIDKRDGLIKNEGKKVKGYDSPIYIREDLLDIFTSVDTENNGKCAHEEKYYDSLVDYFRSIIREYCQLPYLRREEIFLKDTYTLIRECIKYMIPMRISTSNGQTWIAIPCKLVKSPFETAQYLAAYSYKDSGDPTNKIPASFRISTIVKADKATDISLNKLSANEERMLDNLIDERGIQFLLAETEEIKVRFTDKGKDIFKHSINMRPIPCRRDKNGDYVSTWINDNEDEYTFKCSIRQASYYFFKFGKDIEILSPEKLRRTFKAKYKEGYEVYNKDSE